MQAENAIIFNILGHGILLPYFLPRFLLVGPEENLNSIAGTLF